jgi:hypothetical protein
MKEGVYKFLKHGLIIVGIVFLFLLCKYVLLGLIFPTCDYYGGFMMSDEYVGATRCECAGFKYTVIDQAPVDGTTLKLCIGIVKIRICTDSVGGKMMQYEC